MKLKIPPAVVVFLFGLAMYVLAKFLPVGTFDFFGREYFAIGFLVLAGFVVFISLFQFYRSKTTVDPISPSKASSLVINGIYKFSRNPMYLAMLLVLFAWSFWLGNAFNTLLAACFVYYMNVFQIIPEEEALVNIFGSEYSKYCSQVRRWF